MVVSDGGIQSEVEKNDGEMKLKVENNDVFQLESESDGGV